MTKVIFIEYDGTEHAVEGEDGASLMRAAIDNDVPGIDADCGGQCACATCHVYVDDAWFGKTGARTEMEESMLDMAEGFKPNSRLACQVTITPDLDGIVVRTPEAQH